MHGETTPELARAAVATWAQESAERAAADTRARERGAQVIARAQCLDALTVVDAYFELQDCKRHLTPHELSIWGNVRAALGRDRGAAR